LKYKGAADAIEMWNKPAVLIPRRKREKALFLEDL
jgi:GH24 family phage-related lysozyme (muramidase)